MILRLRSQVLVQLLGITWLLAGANLQAAQPSTAELVRAAGAGDEVARIAALDQLAAQGEKAAEAVPVLTKLLGDSSAAVRAHAAHALGQIGKPSLPAVPALASLAKDDDSMVRRQAVKAIVAIRPGPAIMMPLMVKMLEDSDPAVRVRILNAASEAGAAAVPGLIVALGNEKAAYWACLVLHGMGPVAKDAVPALAQTLKDPRPDVRREAALALGAIGEAAGSAAPQLAAALDDADAKGAATFALGQIGQVPADAQAKILANTKSEDKFLSTVSYWTLARVQPDNKELRREATERLVERLMDKDAYVRAAAARALASLPPAPEITLPIIEKALANADEATVHHALDALVMLGPAAVPRLIDALKHKKLRGPVLYVLGQLGPAAAPATDTLSKLLVDEDVSVATEAAVALAKIGPAAQGAVPALIAALQPKDCPNEHALVYALGSIGGPAAKAAEPKLVDFLENPDRSLAIMSAWALTQLNAGSPQRMAFKTFPVLLAGLADSLPESRHTAAEALGNLGPLARNAIPALEVAAKDRDPAVRAAATDALAKIRK